MNIKNCGRRNVRKHKDVKGSDKYVTLDISLKFDNLDKMKITYLDSKGKLERSGKGLITSLGFEAKVKPQKYKKSRNAIGNFSKKDLSKIIREVEKFDKFPYEKKRTKHEPTDSYFYLARQLVKCIVRSDTLNWHGYGGCTKMTAPSSNVNSADEDESKRIIVHEALLHNCSANKDESKQSIVNETLSQNYSLDVDKTCSKEIDKPEYTQMPTFNVSNVFEYGRNNPDVSYKRAYMATEGNE